jgi:hypothetical protein
MFAANSVIARILVGRVGWWHGGMHAATHDGFWWKKLKKTSKRQ